MSSQPPKVFISYAHEDKAHKERLVVHLQGLVERSLISSWHDGLIVPGQQWDAEIVRNLDDSGIILLLIGPDFIASEYINRVELKRAADRHARGEVIVIPILTTNVYGWQAKPFGTITLGALQALPSNFQFVAEWQNREAAYADIVKGIEDALQKHSLPQHSQPQSGVPGTRAIIPRPPMTGFVARRDTEGRDILKRLITELAPEKQQLLALCGDGGWGKTTLAAEAVRALRAAFAQRIAWVSADGRPEFALSTLLDGVAEQLGRPELRQLRAELKEEQLRALVSDSPTLIVLDNFETIAKDEQVRCAGWLDSAACSAVITSRIEVPDAIPINISAMTPPEAHEFVTRLIGQARHPQSFKGLDRDGIINAADRNPLVLQWIVKQIDKAKRPDTVLSELVQGKGDAAERVFGRSFGLLNDDARAALLALSLFAPSASRAALGKVADFGEDEPRLDAAAAQLAELWLANTTERNERLTVEGLTRELAKCHLARDDRAGEFRRRFVAYFMEYAEAHAQETPEDFDALEAERENLLATIDAAFEGKQWRSVMAIRYALEEFLDVRGYWDEAIRRGQQAVESAHAEGDERAAARFTFNSAVIRVRRGEYDAARQSFSQTIAAYKKVGDELAIATALHNLAMIAQQQGEVDEARDLYTKSLEISKRLGNQRNVAATLHELGRLAQNQGEARAARDLYTKSLEIAKRLGDQVGVAVTLHELARLAQAQGEIDEARRLYGESLEIAKRLGDQVGVASTLHQLAILAQAQGEIDEARRLYGESLEIDQRLGNQGGVAITLHELGRLAQAQGEVEEARRLYGESLEIKKKLGNQRGVATTLSQLGIIHITLNEFAESRAKHDESLAISRRIGDQLGIAVNLNQLGRIAEAEGDKTEAARLFRGALSIFERLGSPNAEIARRNLDSLEDGES